MRKTLTSILLGILMTVAVYEIHRAIQTRKPDVYLQSVSDQHALVVFRWHGERLATYIPIIPQILPSYTVQCHVWHQDLVEGPDHKDIYLYALEHKDQPLPWSMENAPTAEEQAKNYDRIEKELFEMKQRHAKEQSLKQKPAPKQ
jgi:hypothetical protein